MPENENGGVFRGGPSPIQPAAVTPPRERDASRAPNLQNVTAVSPRTRATHLVASEIRRPPMALHTAMIDGVQVPGYRYVVYGTKRGYVSTHRTKAAAERSLAEDSRMRMRAGTPSDAVVYRWRDGWVQLGHEVNVELVDVELIETPDAK